MTKYFVVSGFRKLIDRLEASPDIVREEAENMADEIGNIGAQTMRFRVVNSGTDFSRAAQEVGVNQGPGRIRTGALFDSIDYRVESGQRQTRSVIGYLNDYEEYFLFQEEGFDNYWSASYVNGVLQTRRGEPKVYPRAVHGLEPTQTPGIMALEAAEAEINDEMPRLLKKYKTRITKRLNGTL